MTTTTFSNTQFRSGSVSAEFRSAREPRVRSDSAVPSPTSKSGWHALSRSVTPLAALVAILFTAGCSNEGKKSAALAKDHVQALALVAHEDVREVRSGLPLGVAELAKILPPEGEIDPQTAREALEKTRSKVQDLRVAKSTFFALVAPTGIVIRDDQQQDRLAGKNLFDAFPGLRAAFVTPAVVETRGSMPEAAEVRGKPDAQWVAAAGVRTGPTARVLYATGWSWSAYAYRLENAVRSAAHSAASPTDKEPLLYAFVIVENDVYGAPVSPDVNAKAVHDHVPIGQLHQGVPLTDVFEITGRNFGLAAELAPDLGDKVAIAVLRSET